MSARLELKDFIKRARSIHGKKYGYDAVRYRNIDSRVNIKCPTHGYFEQIAWNHIGRPRSGCPKCGDLRMAEKRRSKNADAFVNEARKIHGNHYDYSKAVYKAINKPVCVICPLHGEFWPTPHNHITLKSRCFKCAKKESAKKVIEEFEKTFVQRARQIHGLKYDYKKATYKGASKPVAILCKKHGLFYQTPAVHLSGGGCKTCGRERLRKMFTFTNKEFLKRARRLHRKKYQYLESYKNSQTPIKIRCPDHGCFSQTPANHLSGSGCAKCSNRDSGKEKRMNHLVFVKKAKKIHPSYTFPQRYVASMVKINIRCQKHGLFKMRPNTLLQGHGCQICDDEKSAERNRLTHEEFLHRCRKVHAKKYSYPERYKDGQTPIKIICQKHGQFIQKPSNHLMGNGCPICFESSGERRISRALDRLKVQYVRQKKFPDLVHKKQLRFDFWLPSFKTLIEFDGIQHFEASRFFGGKKGFDQTRTRDQIKTTWAKKMKLPLIRIRYSSPMPEEVLKRKLKI